MGKRTHRKRGICGLVCVVVLVAIAMAPIAQTAFCAVLVPLPMLFGELLSRPVTAPSDAPIQPIQHRSVHALRAPPSSSIF